MEQAKNVKLVILDVDGVMTDGRVIIDDNGVNYRSFDIKDGFGTVALQMSGIPVAIITTSTSDVVTHRAKELKIEKYFPGSKNKLEVYNNLLQDMGLTNENVCFVGDDLVDLPLLKRVGFAVAVNDAVDEVKEQAHYITKNPGGRGAVREVAEIILKAQGKWENILSKVVK